MICGNGYSREKAASTISSGWSLDPVHPNKHIYAKMALNLLEKLAPQEKLPAAATTAQSNTSRKRTWSASNWSDAGSCGDRNRTGSAGRHGGGHGAAPAGASTRTAGNSATAPMAAKVTSTHNTGRMTGTATMPNQAASKAATRPPPPTGAAMPTPGIADGGINANWMPDD